jgi:putative hydrolase
MASQTGRQAIDWNTAQRVGELIAGSARLGSPPTGPRPRPQPPKRAPAQRPAAQRPARGQGKRPTDSAMTAPDRSAQELAYDFARRVGEYTGLELPNELPPLEMVDRPAWIAANLLTMRPMLDRVIERLSGEGTDEEGVGDAETEPGDPSGRRGWEARLGPLSGPMRTASGHLQTASETASSSLRVASGHLLGAQLGAVTGILSQRVLGQYDVSLIGEPVTPRLLLLEPNLAAAARNLDIDRGDLTAWVAIHEITHAVQFAGAPWLRGHLGGLLEELLAGLQLANENDLGSLFSRARNGSLDFGRLVERARQGELLRLGLGEERWEIVERLQATMSLIEGHAEHTMDAVGADVLPSLPELRAALTRRRATRGLPWRVLEKLLGLELKMKQYEVGRRFCDAIVGEAGPRMLTIAWRSPEDLPSPDELSEPELWLARVRVPA